MKKTKYLLLSLGTMTTIGSVVPVVSCAKEKPQFDMTITGQHNIDIASGEVITFKASKLSKNEDVDVDWSISDTKVATINQNGVLSPEYGGSATITATSKVNSDIKATFEIEVADFKHIMFKAEDNGLVSSSGKDKSGKIVLPSRRYVETTSSWVEVPGIADRGFTSCSTLKKVVLPNNYKYIGNEAFYNCLGIEEINIPSNVYLIGESAFSDCGMLKTISIPSSVLSLGIRCFYRCSSLKTINFSEGLLKIGDYAFAGCKSLANFEFPKSLMIYGQDMFNGCDESLFTTDATNKIVYLKSGANKYACVYKASDLTKTSYVINDNAEIIFPYAFNNCDKLQTFTVGKNIHNIGIGAFANCDVLSELKVHNENVIYTSKSLAGSECNCIIEKDTNVLVSGCTGTKSIPEGVEYIQQSAFEGALIGQDGQTFVIGSTVKYIGVKAFWCYKKFEMTTKLTKLSFANNSQLKYIDDEAFRYQCKITSLDLPDSIIAIGDKSFAECHAITNVKMPKNLSYINHTAFFDCRLENGFDVTFPNDSVITTLDGFTGTNIKSINIPNSVTLIAYNAFEGDKKLQSITIPAGVTAIGTGAFLNCTALTSATFTTKAGWKAGADEISETDLGNVETAAQYLSKTSKDYPRGYADSPWKRA